MKTIMFSVEKVTKNFENKYIDLPFKSNTWGVNAKIKIDNKLINEIIKDTNKKVCYGKVVFKNYFKRLGYTYMVRLFNANSDEKRKIDHHVTATIILPVFNNKAERELKVSIKFLLKIYINMNFSVLPGMERGLNVQHYKDLKTSCVVTATF